MEALLQFMVQGSMRWLMPVIAFTVTLAIGWGLRTALDRTIRPRLERQGNRVLALLSQAAHGPFLVWVLALAVHLAVQTLDLPPRQSHYVETWAARVLIVLLIISLTWMFARLAGSIFRVYGAEIPSALPVTTLTQTLAQLAVVILGIVVLLNQLGISITPILTALGVGGLAVALALQDTLSNLFAGFYMGIAGQVRLGDYIKLNTGEEGYVADITWRSTSIRALANNLVIVPNNKLAQAVVTNYHLPEKRMGISVQTAVSYSSDIDRVESILRDVVQQAAREVPGALTEPPPSVMFDPGFTETAIVFTVSCQVAEFVNQYPVRHELRKRIFRRLREEGIRFGWPTPTVIEGALPVQEAGE